jgi:uncharacterized membrane protein YfcA
MSAYTQAMPAAAPARPSVAREFLLQQGPFIVATLVLGYVSAYLQHGFVPNGEHAYPLAQVRVPVWHVIWMGAWTGYTMALVAQAAGVFALPYTMSVLQFSNPHVTSTTLLLTFLNPIGALLGFRRTGQWNLDFAAWICAGGVLGGLIGPFLRATVLAAQGPFRFTLGLALAFFGIQLCYRVLRPAPVAQSAAVPTLAQHAGPIRIDTLAKLRGRITIGYAGQSWTLNQWTLFLIGLAVGVISAALGVGGGFLIVPLLVAAYRLPMYVLPAATIPYAVVLSAVGLFTYCVILPLTGSAAIQPEWAWGFFAAAGGIFGSWVAAKTQLYVPEHFLKIMLGVVTGIVGALYVVNFFVPLPFKI